MEASTSWYCPTACKCPPRQLLDNVGLTHPGDEINQKNPLKAVFGRRLLNPAVLEALSNLDEDDSRYVKELLDQATAITPPSYAESQRTQRCVYRRRPQPLLPIPDTLGLESRVRSEGDWAVAGGHVSDIHKGRYKGKTVALKVIRMFNPDEDTKEAFYDFWTDALAWRDIAHPNIIEFHGMTDMLFEPRPCIVLPWMEHGNVRKFLRTYPDFDRLRLVTQLASGLACLHRNRIVHGDIRGANLLIDSDYTLKISDVGLAEISEKLVIGFCMPSGSSGLVRWMAPEMLDNFRRDFKTDTYSFAMTACEMFSGLDPFRYHKRDIQVITSLLAGQRPSRNDPLLLDCNATPDIWDIIERCWSPCRNMRPTMEEVSRTLNAIYDRTQTSDDDGSSWDDSCMDMEMFDDLDLDIPSDVSSPASATSSLPKSSKQVRWAPVIADEGLPTTSSPELLAESEFGDDWAGIDLGELANQLPQDQTIIVQTQFEEPKTMQEAFRSLFEQYINVGTPGKPQPASYNRVCSPFEAYSVSF